MKAAVPLFVLVLLASSTGCRRGNESAPPAADAVTPPPAAAPAPVPPASQPAAEPERASSNVPPGAKYREVTLPAGTKFGVRLGGSVSSDTSHVQDALDATVIQPILINEIEVVPAGAHMKGHVSAIRGRSESSSRAPLLMEFTTLDISGDSYPVSAQISEAAPATKGADAVKAGIPPGGDKVAGGRSEAFPKGSVLSLRLAKAVTVRVPKK